MLFDLYLTYIHYIVCSRLLDSKTVLLLVRKQNTSMIKVKFYCKPRVCVIIRVKWKVVFNIQTVLFEGGFCIGIHSFNSNTGNHRFLLKEQTKACTLVYTNTTTTSFVFDWFDVNLWVCLLTPPTIMLSQCLLTQIQMFENQFYYHCKVAFILKKLLPFISFQWLKTRRKSAEKRNSLV